MAALTVTTVGRNNTANLTTAAVAAGSGGDTFVNDGNTCLAVINGSGAAVTVTFGVVTTVDGQSVTNKAVSVPAGDTVIIGPFPTNTYNNSTTGAVSVSYSAVTSLTVFPFRFSPNQ